MYVAVVGVAMIVAIIGMCSLQLSRTQLRNASSVQDLDEAQSMALTAIDMALGRTELDPDWRNTYVSGQTYSTHFGNGFLEFGFTDPVDGILSDDASEPVEITGVGKIDEAIFVYKVDCTIDTTASVRLVPGSLRRVAYGY